MQCRNTSNDRLHRTQKRRLEQTLQMIFVRMKYAPHIMLMRTLYVQISTDRWRAAYQFRTYLYAT